MHPVSGRGADWQFLGELLPDQKGGGDWQFPRAAAIRNVLQVWRRGGPFRSSTQPIAPSESFECVVGDERYFAEVSERPAGWRLAILAFLLRDGDS